MSRGAIVLTLASVLGASTSAPFQCGKSSNPETRLEDTAGDALWALAEDFRAKGDERARHDTLRFLAERYPSNRYAAAARAESAGPPPVDTPDAGAR